MIQYFRRSRHASRRWFGRSRSITVSVFDLIEQHGARLGVSSAALA